jgi:hypothetical protein
MRKGLDPITESDRPRVRVKSSASVTLAFAKQFVREYVNEEETVLFREEEEHSNAISQAENSVGDGYAGLNTKDAESLEIEAAKRKVCKSEPDIDPNYLAKLKNFCGLNKTAPQTSISGHDGATELIIKEEETRKSSSKKRKKSEKHKKKEKKHRSD